MENKTDCGCQVIERQGDLVIIVCFDHLLAAAEKREA